MTRPAKAAAPVGGHGIWARLVAGHKNHGGVETTYPVPSAIEDQIAPAVRSAPMASADLVFEADGRVAWDQIWADFCDLALTGGPPHRGTMLHAPSVDDVATDLPSYERVREEMGRGLAMTTNWPVERDGPIGWIGLVCPNGEAAMWMARAIEAENVAARVAGTVVFVPAGPAFTLKGETKNVVTAVAKAWHYWAKHGMR